jgi:lipoate-protein ligase A
LKEVNAVLSDNFWWWLDCGPMEGGWHMAADQYFADSMVRLRRPVMRIYQWQPWCISLGHHQSSSCVNLNQCHKDSIDVVRRQTGGRAVYHAEEITYSIIIPAGHDFADSVSGTYHRLSEGLVAGLRTLGIPASFQKRGINFKDHYATKISASCFSAAALHEIVVRDKKLVGSAQRRMSDSVLQHGSILIGPAHLNLFRYLTGLESAEQENMTREVAEKTTYLQAENNKLNYQLIGRALKQGMREALGVQFKDKKLSSEDEQKISVLKKQFVILENMDQSGH